MSDKPHRRLSIVALAASLWAAWWGICLAQPLPVRAVPAEASRWSRQINVLGRVESIGRVTLNAPVGGRVLGPFLPPGSIPKGAVVARIAPPGLAAEIRAAQVRAAYARTQLARAGKLYQDGVVARQRVDQARLALAQARSSLAALEAQAGQQRLTAPFSGALRYLVPPDAVVNAGSAIARLTGRGKPWAEAYVTPGQARTLAPGTIVAMKTQGWQGEGRVRSVGQSARHMGLVSVYIVLPQASPLLPGQWLQLTLPGVGGPAFKVPTRSVVMHGARAVVYTIRQGHAYAIAVQVVASRGAETWVSGPLRGGEPVVVSGSGRVVSGAPVATIER